MERWVVHPLSHKEAAALVTYVSSLMSSATNGAALRVDGGVVRSILYSF